MRPWMKAAQEALVDGLEDLKQMKVVNKPTPASLHLIVAELEDLRRDLNLVLDDFRAYETLLLIEAGGKVQEADGTNLIAVPKLKKRYDHEGIGIKVVRKACYNAEGEQIDDPRESARRAVDLMTQLYVSPSMKPTNGALQYLGYEVPDAALISAPEVVGQKVIERA